jgi:hypothetical protein
LLSLLSDAVQRATMGAAAEKRITDYYSIRAVQSKFLQLFEQ